MHYFGPQRILIAYALLWPLLSASKQHTATYEVQLEPELLHVPNNRAKGFQLTQAPDAYHINIYDYHNDEFGVLQEHQIKMR